MLQLLAQATDTVVNQGPNSISITLPVALTVGGVCAVAYLLIKLGDRLWRPNRAQGLSMSDSSKGLCDNIEKLGNVVDRNKERVVDNITKLSEVMTRYIELQQASLKLSEYRHEAMLRQLEICSGQASDANTARQADMRAIGDKLENIALSIGKLNGKSK